MPKYSLETLVRSLFGGGVLLFLAGCSTPQAPSTSFTVWTPEEKQERRADEEWTTLRQQALSITGSVSVTELVDLAIQANPVLRQSWAEAKNSEAVMQQAKSAYYPSLTVRATVNSGRTDENERFTPTDMTTYGPEADLQWLLLDLGGRNASLQAAAEQLLASNYSFNQQFQNTLRDVQTAYYNLYGAQAAETASQANVDAAQKTLESTQAREDAGLGMHLDVLQAQTDYESAQYNLVDANSIVMTAHGELARTIGLPADTDFVIAPPEQKVPSEEDLSEATIRQMIDDALAQRPDVAALRATVKAAEYSVTSSASDLWPQLLAGGSSGKTWNDYSAAGLEDNDTYTHLGYIALSWDIFDGFRNVNEKRAAEAALEAAQAQLKSAELAASTDVWTRYYSLIAAIRKLDFAKASLSSAQEAYTQALDNYNTGLKDITFLLNSQSQLSSARSILVSTKNEVYVGFINLAHAMGTLSAKVKLPLNSNE